MNLRRITFTEPNIDPSTPVTLGISIGQDDEGNLYWIPMNHLYPELREYALEVYNSRVKRFEWDDELDGEK